MFLTRMLIQFYHKLPGNSVRLYGQTCLAFPCMAGLVTILSAMKIDHTEAQTFFRQLVDHYGIGRVHPANTGSICNKAIDIYLDF